MRSNGEADRKGLRAYAMMSAPRVAAPAGSPTAKGIWAVVVLGLVERLHRSRRIRTHRHVRDVDVLVLHLHETEVLLGLHLAGRRELRDRAAYATLRPCRPAGSIVVGVAFKTSARNCNGPQSIMAAQAA